MVLPVLIALLVFILIILLVIFCNRRKRQRHLAEIAEKEILSNERNPIIFPDEMDRDELRCKSPVVLPSDSHTSTPSRLGSPTSSNLDPQPELKLNNLQRDNLARDREIWDNRDQLWLAREQQHQKKQQQEKRKRNQDKNRNRNNSHNSHPRRSSKDGGHHQQRRSSRESRERYGGVSPTLSSLSSEWPHNHYLEEEGAGSRSSTLNSRHSHLSDRRQRSPPPYWPAQSDPPPYRLPPPYLTDPHTNTTQV